MRLNVHEAKPSTIVLKRQPMLRAIVLDDSTMLLGMKNINSSPARTALAHNVKRLRKSSGLNQVQLARKAGVAQTAISYIENPGGKSPSLETIEAVAGALRVPHWALSLTSVEVTPEEMESAGFVLTTYFQLPRDGKFQVRRAAEAEARYHAVSPPPPTQ